jgi:hypothetical protein
LLGGRRYVQEGFLSAGFDFGGFGEEKEELRIWEMEPMAQYLFLVRERIIC